MQNNEISELRIPLKKNGSTLVIKKHLETSLEALNPADNKRFLKFLEAIHLQGGLWGDLTKGKIRKINIPGAEYCVYRLSPKIRILMKIDNKLIHIIDILSRQRFDTYFGV